MTAEATKYEIKDLDWVKLMIPQIIPKALIENVKGRTFTPEQFVQYQSQAVSNPGNILFALIDPEKKIHGYLWAEINGLDNSLFVNTFTISKDYWHKGQALEKATDLLRILKDKYKPSRIFWMTTNEKFFRAQGFKRSKNCLMEYTC